VRDYGERSPKVNIDCGRSPDSRQFDLRPAIDLGPTRRVWFSWADLRMYLVYSISLQTLPCRPLTSSKSESETELGSIHFQFLRRFSLLFKIGRAKYRTVQSGANYVSCKIWRFYHHEMRSSSTICGTVPSTISTWPVHNPDRADAIRWGGNGGQTPTPTPRSTRRSRQCNNFPKLHQEVGASRLPDILLCSASGTTRAVAPSGPQRYSYRRVAYITPNSNRAHSALSGSRSSNSSKVESD
jgi:hypothetical protein